MHQSDALNLRCGILTISDTRTFETDTSGQLIAELLIKEKHQVTQRLVVRDDPREIQAAFSLLEEENPACIISTGGTGLAKRDVTFEALYSHVEQEIPGFGELFRMISYSDIGSKAMASQAFAGFTANDILFFALPGSKNAVSTGMQKLILAEMPHLIAERRK
ncbi:molybdenum cofactor biosynthesis protein B [Listeria floridensis FSL S10-1187]|uniref:Molybdenum cofactor biosynthesis protein B n=1 Tax=Listeria floridensis FSL S10-1187 TaxID=1265817 RepID=A0ABP3AZN3_9LIST|nr:MogA/MoaB family molybdenum cofactor biosynthesis protein [Listeria floridensis]EUJ33061.1 molybdenum cofactor biosynthesis protein B [Listeria floridensis FSL S10-1187]